MSRNPLPALLAACALACPAAADTVAYADRRLARAYDGLSLQTGEYPNACYSKTGVTHRAAWAASDATHAAALARLADAADVILYPLTDPYDGARIIPAYDELFTNPKGRGAYVQCYPWADETDSGFGYSAKTWEIDSALWSYPNVVAVFARGAWADLGYVPSFACARNALASDDPVGTALAALASRRRLVADGFADPSAPLVRADLAAGSRTRAIDRLPYRSGGTLAYLVTTTNAADLTCALAWNDTGVWDFPYDPRKDYLAVDLDLTVSASLNGEPHLWMLDDHAHSLEKITIPDAPPATYLIEVRCADTAIEDSASGGVAALVLSGAFNPGADEPGADTVELTIAAGGPFRGDTAPEPGTYRLPRGTSITVGAAPYAYACGDGGVAFARYALDAPTNRLALTLTDSTNVTWRWREEPSDYRVRTFAVFDDDDANALPVDDFWLADNARLAVRRPQDWPFGEECVRAGVTYRAGAAEWGYTDDWRWGVLSDNWSDGVDFGRDLLFSYYDETLANWYAEGSELPMYWFSRYLLGLFDAGEGYADEDDPDGDGFTNLEEYRGRTNPVDAGDRPGRQRPFSWLLF